MKSIILSIVTICYNCRNDIEKTMISVEQQLDNLDDHNIEYVIVDGLSKDGTVEFAENKLLFFQNRGVNTVFISEKDNGIYDAINKGVKNSNGKWVIILNAGDVFHDSLVLKKALHELKHHNPDVLYGNTMRINPYYSESWIPGNIEMIKNNMIFCHQSVFIRREIEGHYYNLKFKYCADYDLLLRLYLAGRDFRYLNYYISDYSLEGVSANSGIVDAYKEIYAIRRLNDVIVNKCKEKLLFILGIMKRYLIILLPVNIRWKLTRLIHNYRNVRKIKTL